MIAAMSTSGAGEAVTVPNKVTNLAKRKRDEDGDNMPASNVNVEVDTSSTACDAAVQGRILDLFELLKSHDISPSIIDFDLTPLTGSVAIDETEPVVKRAKLSISDTSTTIAHKVHQCAYSSVNDFVSDADGVMRHLIDAAKLTISDTNRLISKSRSTNIQDVQIARISALKKHFHDVISREQRRLDSRNILEPTTLSNKQEYANGFGLTNGHTAGAPVKVKSEEDTENDDRVVLTLFGSAQGHKQLFSSFQKPASHSDALIGEESFNTELEMHLPLQEIWLPNGITASRIPSNHQPDQILVPNKRASTFKDTFGPRSNLPTLQPPKTPKPSTQHNNGSGWYRKRPAYETTTQRGYSSQKMTTGHWLGYAGVAPAQELATPEVRRRLRDRALSSGEAQLTPSEEIINAQAMAKEDALFRSAYSSFAPSRDNSAAIYSDEMKSTVWWERIGKQVFERTFGIDPALDSDAEVFTTGTTTPFIQEYSNEELKEAVDEFSHDCEMPAELRLDTKRGPIASGDQDVDEILKDVSELLETLHSYQRIRNASLTSVSRPGSRPGTGHGTPLHKFTGTPNMPSTAEVETYNTLKAQLALLISVLPPYAVARLNGEMLEDLNITQRLPINAPDARGVLEEDQFTRDAKAAAINAAVGTAATNQARANALAQSQYGNVSRNAQLAQPNRSNFSGRPMQNGTYNTPQANFSRQPLSSWQKTPSQPRSHVGPLRTTSSSSDNVLSTPKPNTNLGANTGLYRGGRSSTASEYKVMQWPPNYQPKTTRPPSPEYKVMQWPPNYQPKPYRPPSPEYKVMQWPPNHQPKPYRPPSPQYKVIGSSNDHLSQRSAQQNNQTNQTPQSYQNQQKTSSSYQSNNAVTPTRTPTASMYSSSAQQHMLNSGAGGIHAIQTAAAAQLPNSELEQQQQAQSPNTAASSTRYHESSSPQPQSLSVQAPVANMNAIPHMYNNVSSSVTVATSPAKSPASPVLGSKPIEPSYQGLRPGSAGNEPLQMRSPGQKTMSVNPIGHQISFETPASLPTSQTQTIHQEQDRVENASNEKRATSIPNGTKVIHPQESRDSEADKSVNLSSDGFKLNGTMEPTQPTPQESSATPSAPVVT